MSNRKKVVSGSSDKQDKTRPARVMLAGMGEYYEDALTVEAALKNRPIATEAASLLCAKLQEREESRNRMLDHLAWKRGISRQEVKRLILAGKLGSVDPSEIPAELRAE